MKIQKTRQYASIYLLTALILLSAWGGGCAERSEEKPASEPVMSVSETFNLLDAGLASEKLEKLPNGTISRSSWEYSMTGCQLVVKEQIDYKRTKAPFGGFNKKDFLPAWQSTRRFALGDLDLNLIKAQGPHIKLQTLDHKNLIKEENLYTEAYLAYYQAENGTTHPAQSTFDYNFITLFQQDSAAPTPAVEHLKMLLTHCQAN
ncbi:MAG: hypothetical protein AAF927_28500 [Bacteroidota bacterium]